MPTTTTQPRPLRSADVVMELIASAAPHLLEHAFMDRSWIWICNINLSGEANKATREKLKEIGFRFSMQGHIMPDGKTVGKWGHCTLRPQPFKRHRNGVVPTRDQQPEPEDVAAQLRAMGL